MTSVVTRVRRPLVAGYYYPKDAGSLRAELERLVTPACVGAFARAAIVPHGSYAFSGAIAGAVYRQLRIPARCIVLAPNHTGAGARWSLMAQGAYASPLGELPIDEALAERLRRACLLLEDDELAQRAEHAIEVQVPFLQWCGPVDVALVPVVINSDDPGEWEQMADALVQIWAEEPEVLVVASADFSHYVPHDRAQAQDHRLLQAIAALNAEELRERVRAESMVMCGLAPVACLLGALRRVGASHAEVLRYGTSAEAGGDPQSVTGYAGVVMR